MVVLNKIANVLIFVFAMLFLVGSFVNVLGYYNEGMQTDLFLAVIAHLYKYTGAIFFILLIFKYQFLVEEDEELKK